MIAAIAPGLAGAVALARRDVAAVLPGVAIAISLVPPLAVAGVCLGDGSRILALGALLMFLSNLLAMVLAGTLVYTFLGYADHAIARDGASRRRAYTVLGVLLTITIVPLAGNTVATYLLNRYANQAAQATARWLSSVPGATVSGVSTHGLSLTIAVQSPTKLPPTSPLLSALDGLVPGFVGITVSVTNGQEIGVRSAG